MCELHLIDKELKEVLLSNGNVIPIPEYICFSEWDLEKIILEIKNWLLRSHLIQKNDFITSLS